VTQNPIVSTGPKTTKAGVKKPAEQPRCPIEPMNATISPQQRKKISQGAAMLGRIGGARTTPAQTAQRRKSIAYATKIRLEKRKKIAA
jgi:hypothetical protein